MKKLLAPLLIGAALATTIAQAEIITHCPEAKDIFAIPHWGIEGVTEYNVTKAIFRGSSWNRNSKFSYFKLARLVPANFGEYFVRCIYIQESGAEVELSATSPSMVGAGSDKGPWFATECNSKDPSACLFKLD